MHLLLAEAVPAEGIITALIGHGVLGLVAAIALAAAWWAVRSLGEVQAARVGDNQTYGKAMEESAKGERAAQADHTKAILSLAEALREQNKILDRNTRAVEDHTRTLDTTIRDALRGRRSGESDARMQAVRPLPPRGGNDPRRE